MKTCRICLITKNKIEFYGLLSNKDGLDHRCKACVSLKGKKHRQENKSKYREKQIQYRKKNPHVYYKYELKRYNLTVENYLKMVELQNGVCAICKNPNSTKTKLGETRRLVVDHCHETGKIRGLLCDKCNHGIGLFKDNPNNLMEAASYLKKPHPYDF